MANKTNFSERFWGRVNFDSPVSIDYEDGGPCWLWVGYTDRGYGFTYFERKIIGAHRVSWLLLIGPLPARPLMLDHLCRNRNCVNPHHLEIVTNRENVLRGVGYTAVNARKTHCIRGHEFTLENTRPMYNPAGRACRTCDNSYAARKREQV